MDYRIYKLRFSGMVHLGSTNLEDSEYSLSADTLFSALCHEAVKTGDKMIERLYTAAKNGDISLSDAFPYIGDELFVPKPYKRITNGDDTGDSTIKKAYKKLKYIPAGKLDEYLKGNYDVMSEGDLEGLGKSQIKVSAAIRGEEETKPYRVGMYSFNKNNGLYMIIGYNKEEDVDFTEELLNGLSYSGIGGKRNSGLGRFDPVYFKMPDVLNKRLGKRGETNMSLSVCLPRDDELDDSMRGAQYSLIKRSGFVQSDTYAGEQMKKRDLYVFKAGSCFANTFEGDVYDVSTDAGAHPVYRYAKPMFLEVDA